MNIEKIKEVFKRYYPYFAILFFAVISIVIMSYRVPFWDEAHQVDIARLSIFEIFKITRVIGHPVLWYFIIKPFSSPNLYPYAIYILNWVFCMISLVILWKKSPFNLLVKTLITFSVPFLFYFAPVSRCYGLSLVILFLLCVYFKEKEHHPYIFASLIVLGANLSEMLIIGCFYLGLIFLYDLYKEKSPHLKNIIIIFFLCSLLILAQFIGTKEPFEVQRNLVLGRMLYFVIIPLGATIYSFLLHLFSSIMFYVFPFYCFKKSKKAFFFIVSVFLTLTYIFLFRYIGSYWNHYFYFIYFIMVFWLFYEKLYENKFIKVLFCLILFMFCFRASIFDNLEDVAYISHSNEIAEIISEYKDNKIYVMNGWSDISPGADIFLLQKGIDIYDIHNRKKTSYQSLKNIYKIIYENIDFDDFIRNMPDNSIITAGSDFRSYRFIPDTLVVKHNNNFIVQTKDNVYYLQNLVNREDIKLFIYKPINIVSYGKIKVWK